MLFIVRMDALIMNIVRFAGFVSQRLCQETNDLDMYAGKMVRIIGFARHATMT